MTIDDAHGGLSAQRRLAQTRTELAELLLPAGAAVPTAAIREPGVRTAASAQHAATAAAAELAAERKAARRAAALAQFEQDAVAADRVAADAGTQAPPRHRAARPVSSGFAWTPLLRHGASIWWRHHPAHAAFEVADSALYHVAVRKPYLMLGVAAGAGALVVLLRPWRLVSVSALALAALRMTNVRSLFGSLMRGE